MWWIRIYIELNFLLLPLDVHSSMQIVLILGLFARIPSIVYPSGQRADPFVLRLPVQEASFHQVVPSPVVFSLLVHDLHGIFYICVPLIPLFTNLILSWF